MIISTQRRWSTTAIIDMVIIYYQGFRLDEMAMVLEKTPSSIQKKMNRLKIKPPKSPLCSSKVNRHIPEGMTQQELRAHIQMVRHKLKITDKDTIGRVISIMTEHYPLHTTHRKRKNIFEPNTEYRDPQWKSLEQICRFLQQNHIYPKKLKDKSVKSRGFSHTLNGQFTRPEGLLIEANKINRSLNRDLYYLTNHTET